MSFQDCYHPETRDAQGNQTGVFDTNTNPTGAQVINLIEIATSDVGNVIGEKDVPEELEKSAEGVVALLVAQRIELGFFPEDIAGNRSAYDSYVEAYARDLKALKMAVAQVADNEVVGAAAGYNTPAHKFPSHKGIGFETDF